MALIKCINCNSEISDQAEKCIHCGTPVSKSIKKEIEEEKSVPIPKKEIIDQEKNVYIEFNKKFIIDSVLCLILMIFVFLVGTIVTKHSGIYSIARLIDWFEITYLSFDIPLLTITLFIYLLLCSLFMISKKKVLNILSKIGFILFTIFELIFLLLASHRWAIDNMYYVLIIYTIALIIYSFVFKNKKIEVDNNSESNKSDNLDKLIKLKTLLDNEVITKDEFEDMKKNILEKEKN